MSLRIVHGITVQVADIASKRVTPGLVLFQGDVTIFAEHIGEVTERNTLANLITFVGRIGDALYLPEITKLIKCLCFSGPHGAVPLTLIEYTRTAPNQPIVDSLCNWHISRKLGHASRLVYPYCPNVHRRKYQQSRC